MFIKVILTIIFLVVMVGVGVYSRKQASSVEGFVLGGRAVGPCRIHVCALWQGYIENKANRIKQKCLLKK